VSDTTPILLWFRRDLRLSDHPALDAAARSRRPVIPVFICDEVVEHLGAAPKWRLGLGVARFGKALEGIGSRLILRRGKALDVLQDLMRETGAGAVWWSRQYDPDQVARDAAVKSALRDQGLEARSFRGHLIFEPWQVETGTGKFYQVYTPFWKAVRGRDVPARSSSPARLPAPDSWPESDRLEDWQLGRAMDRGAGVVQAHLCVGERAAQDRLALFARDRIAEYAQARDQMGRDGCSGLSENLTYGEISPLALWHSARRAMEEGKPGAETFLKEVVWREFAYHLIYHTPHITQQSWRAGWERFPWQDEDRDTLRWKQGRTGIEIVDAAMRELYVTGRMHNRARMLVGSYLTKHMLTHWRVGQDWFADTLVDWDPAANAMGWQWVAGSGPDASPYFRIFNPDTQAEKFDADGSYRRRWLAEISRDPPDTARAFFDACPRSWGLRAGMAYPDPVVPLKEGRDRALDAYQTRQTA